MTKEIIYTENYALIVDDSEIKEADWCLDLAKDRIVKYTKEDCSDHCKKIIFHLPLNGSKELEGVPKLPEIQYQFTEENMRLCFEASRRWVVEIFENFIQSLKQYKRPTNFEFEIGNLSTEETKSDLLFGTYFKTELINGKTTAVGTYKY